MTNTDRIITATIKLTAEQAAEIGAMARAWHTDETAVIKHLVRLHLDQAPQQGPGHTRADILLIIGNSSMTDILDTSTLWDASVFDRHHQWMTNHKDEQLLSKFSISCRPITDRPYMEAMFSQDTDTPNGWRAVLEPMTEEIGELGDHPEEYYPHHSLYAAAQALYEAYAERHGAPHKITEALS